MRRVFYNVHIQFSLGSNHAYIQQRNEFSRSDIMHGLQAAQAMWLWQPANALQNICKKISLYICSRFDVDDMVLLLLLLPLLTNNERETVE